MVPLCSRVAAAVAGSIFMPQTRSMTPPVADFFFEGILPAQLPHVFERFFRGDTARDRSGSGIGLTISKAIIDAHGGSITAHSDGSGHGASFEILLPRAR